MSKRLSENLTSLYLAASNRLKPRKSALKVVAYVESYDDVLFWRSVLGDFENEKYSFEVMLPSQETLQKGKKRVLMNHLGEQLGQNMIACVDADYDYLMQNITNSSRMVNLSPYVFHTYVYAIENYQCYAPGLHSVCVMATLNDRRLIDFEAFLQLFSQIIYPLFVWNIWCYRSGTYKEFSLTDFCEVISFDEVNLYHPEKTLDYVRGKVNHKMNWLQHFFPQAKLEYGNLKDELFRLGVTPDNTYLYIQGHSLFNGVVLPLLEPVCAVLRRERQREIKYLAEHDVQRQNELAAYEHSQADLSLMLRKSEHYKNSPQYQLLKKDLLRFLDSLSKNAQ